MNKERVLSGMQSSGKLHIGNLNRGIEQLGEASGQI